MKYKYIATVILGTQIAAMAVMPFAAFAEDSAKKPMRAGVESKNFCEHITNAKDRMLSKIDQKAEQKNTFADERKKAKEGRFGMRDDWRSGKREDHEKMFEDRIALLRKHPALKDKQAEIDSFASMVHSAVGDRQQAIDSAVAQFRAELESTSADRKAYSTQAVETFKKAMTAAFDKAVADCNNGIAPETVQATLKKDVEAARAALMTARKDMVTDAKAEHEVLVAERKTAFQDIFASFRSRIESARGFLWGNIKTQ